MPRVRFNYSSPTVPPGAIFVAADGQLLAFPSATGGERYLEAADVRAGNYPAAYGPQGEPNRVDCDGDQVSIARADKLDQPQDLKDLLLRYLEATARAYDPKEALDGLVASVWVSKSEFWQEHDPYGDRFSTRIPLLGCVGFEILLAAFQWIALRLR